MKSLRKWYWFTSSFIQKYVLGIVLGVAAGIVVFLGYGRFGAMIPIQTTEHVGRTGAFTLAQLPLDIQQKVSYGLTKIDQNGKVSLDAADSVTVSEDGKTYTFVLKPGLVWSDGKPVVSPDISLNLKDVEVVSPNPQTITFILKEPFAPFPAIVSQPLLKRVTTGKIIKKTRVIGLNAFAITKVATQKQTLTKLTLESKTQKILYHFYPTEDEALTAYKLGLVDQLDMLTSPYLKDWPNTLMEEHTDTQRFLALFYNTADNNLQDKTIRQMLTYAAPKKNDASRVISPISKDSWVYNPQVKPYDYNLETAKNMLKKLKESNKDLVLSFELTTTPAYTDMASRVVDSWQQLGIDAKLKIVTFPDPNEYQILLIGQQVPDDPDQYLLWHSTQPTNITKYQNPKIDKLLEDGRKERDPERRKQIYHDFQRFLVEDSPAAFLHELHTYTLKRV